MELDILAQSDLERIGWSTFKGAIGGIIFALVVFAISKLTGGNEDDSDSVSEKED